MMTPLLFGDSRRELFGAYHPPDERLSGERAVVICPPAPQEYMLTHWAQRRLATILSKAGAHVLRFDYFGTGDSAGAADEGTPEQWQKDVLTAEEKLRALSGASRVSLVGYRLGAAMAWRASRVTPNRTRDLVLWDPVVCGAAYLRELAASERAYASRLLYPPRSRRPPQELWGYPFPPSQRVPTSAVDLLSEPLPNATRVHLYVGRETGETRALSSRLRGQMKRYSFQCVTEEEARGRNQLLAGGILNVISGALSAERS